MLTEDKRPRRLKDIVGQAKAKGFLTGWVKENKEKGTNDVFLITGPSGTGKTSMAYAIAGELDVDNFAFEMIKSGECNIDTVRGLEDTLNHSSLMGGKWKIILVDEAHCMSDAAKNAWLSTLERLPQYRLVIFTTTEPKHFDLVWRSRCKMIELQKIMPSAMFALLKDAVKDRVVPDAVLNGICDKAAGNMRAAYHALEQHLVTVPTEEDEAAVDMQQRFADLTPKKQDGIVQNDREHAALVDRMLVKLEGVSFALKPGTKDGYIEIHFSGKPSEDIRNELKAFKFRWSNFNKCWYGKSDELPTSYRSKQQCAIAPITISEKTPAESTVETAVPCTTPDASKDSPVKPVPIESSEPPAGPSVVKAKGRVPSAESVTTTPNALRVNTVKNDGGEVQYVILHTASSTDIGFRFDVWGQAKDMLDKILPLTDWTKPCEEIMAIPGLEEKLAALLDAPTEEAALIKAAESAVAVAVDPIVQKKKDADAAMRKLKGFIGKSQLEFVRSAMKGEEGEWFMDKMIEIAKIIEDMPKTKETDGQGDNAVVHLHYFKGGCDWHITEKDMEKEQHQAFGLANIGYGGELGYISIVEVIQHGVELDFHWKPKALGDVRGKQGEGPDKPEAPVEPALAAGPKSWKVGVKTSGDKDWCCNSMRYATEAEAKEKGEDLFMRWTAVNEWCVLPSDDPVYPPKEPLVTEAVPIGSIFTHGGDDNATPKIEGTPNVSQSEVAAIEKSIEVIPEPVDVFAQLKAAFNL